MAGCRILSKDVTIYYSHMDVYFLFKHIKQCLQSLSYQHLGNGDQHEFLLWWVFIVIIYGLLYVIWSRFYRMVFKCAICTQCSELVACHFHWKILPFFNPCQSNGHIPDRYMPYLLLIWLVVNISLLIGCQAGHLKSSSDRLTTSTYTSIPQLYGWPQWEYDGTILNGPLQNLQF